MLFVPTGGSGGRSLPGGERYDVAGAVKVGLASIVTVVLINLPFVIIGLEGWTASFAFQSCAGRHHHTRSGSGAMRPFMGDATMQSLVGVLSPVRS